MPILTPTRPTSASASGFATQKLSLRSEGDRNYLSAVLKGYVFDKHKPWEWYNNLGEVHFSVSRSAYIAGYGRLRVGAFTPNGELETELETGEAVDIVSGLVDPYGGVRALLERFYTQRKVCGDSYLIREYEGRQFVGHMFLSPSEVTLVNGDDGTLEAVTWQSLPGPAKTSDKIVHKVSRNNFLGRVWKAHPQWRDLPDSPIMALETECELLHKSTQVLKAKMMNRLTMAGILYIASEIQMAANGDHRATTSDKVLDTLVQIMQSNYETPDGPGAVSPIMLRGPAQFVDAVKFITEDAGVYEHDLQIRQELIERILFGLDISKTATTGESGNRFQSWQASDEERRVAVQPDLEDAAFAFNKLVLWPQLQTLKGWEPERILATRVFITLEKADIRANRSEDARQAADRIAIKDSSFRRDLGYTENDAPDDEEQVRIVGRLMKNPYFMTWGLPIHKQLEDAGAWDYISGTPGPDPDSPADDPAAGPGDSGGGPNDSDPQTPAEGDDPRDD